MQFDQRVTPCSILRLCFCRYDVQLLLEDPSALWAPVSKFVQCPEFNLLVPTDEAENPTLEESLNAERYEVRVSSILYVIIDDCSLCDALNTLSISQNLGHQGLVHFSSSSVPDFFVLPGPTKSSSVRSTGVPTSEERRLLFDSSSETFQSSGDATPSSVTPCEASVDCRPRKLFIPDSSAFDPQYLSSFMREVKEKQTSSGLQSRAFWPSSFGEHLAIEHTARFINQVRSIVVDCCCLF